MSDKLTKKKDIALNRKVKNRDIDQIDEFCRALKNGSKKEAYEAQKNILEYFDSYLEKYVNLFTGAAVNLTNYDTRGFLAMFLTGRSKTPENLSLVRAYITYVMQNFTREDIKSELTLVFLNVLAKYRIVEGVNALNPLTRFFKWRVKDWFNKVVRDPLFKTVDPTGSNNSTLTIEQFIDLNHFVEPEFEDFACTFDMAWVTKPSQNLYEFLSKYERYLIYLVYNQKQSISTVASNLERDKDTIKRHLKKALKKLREKLDESESRVGD